ncbi:MAG: hypothetical protein QM581_14455 [Pseudomonas sp.]
MMELLRHGADPTRINREADSPADLARAYTKQVFSPNLWLSADRSAMTIELAEQQREMVLRDFRQGAARTARRPWAG